MVTKSCCMCGWYIEAEVSDALRIDFGDAVPGRGLNQRITESYFTGMLYWVGGLGHRMNI